MNTDKSVLIVEKKGGGASIAEAARRAAFKVDVRAVESGQELVDFLMHRGAFEDAARFPSPCLILVDLDGAGAVESATQVKRHAELRRIPMVFFASSPDEDQVLRGYEVGANSLIQRPETHDQLVETLKVLQHYWLESVELPNAR